MQAYFAPSLMCMDYLHIEDQIQVLNRHADFLHYDVMDGHFCKNMALSADILKAIKKVAAIPVDVHMMVENPQDHVDAFLDSGADYISLHAETINPFAFRILRHIRQRGAKTGIVLNPATPLEYAGQYLDEVDMLTIMTVDVGFAGQPFNARMLQKIEQAKQWKAARGAHYIIQVDGGVNESTYRALWKAGAECYVVGSSGLFTKDKDLEKGCAILKEEFAACCR